ncbi:hypothetical protein [Neisseria leonii]|uniref:hypothetical protein n=1 Tax=Neisseria leonii TaxID=2995413 RepID=UPI00237B74CD|nr:hypothetical protein [Neisseria sp. 3986]MDD9326263.1 hypothetical protein [Neisseria sp. 3986]
MKIFEKTVLACAAVLALAACGSTGASGKGGGAGASSAPGRSAVADSGACKLQRDNEGAGKNMVFRCNIAAVLKTAEAQSALSNNVPVSFGGSGELRTNAAARSFGRDEAKSCERAIINGVNNLQNPRRARGTVRRVNHVGSYAAGNNGRFDSGRMAPAGYADCIVATFQSRTVMRGTPQY